MKLHGLEIQVPSAERIAEIRDDEGRRGPDDIAIAELLAALDHAIEHCAQIVDNEAREATEEWGKARAAGDEKEASRLLSAPSLIAYAAIKIREYGRAVKGKRDGD